MKIVFMGSAEFGITALEKLMQFHQIAGIVSTPSRPKGRGLKLEDSPIVQFAKTQALNPILTPENLKDPSFIETLQSLHADIFVVVAFRILPREVFSIPKFGTINIHASLLPQYRGPAPIHRAIEAGEKESGVTIFRIDEGIDTGEILMQKTIPIGEFQTTPELYDIMSRSGAELLTDALEAVAKGEAVPMQQNNARAGKAPKLKKEEGLIDWRLPAQCIFNKIRAFKPFPGTFTYNGSQRLGIEWAVPIEMHRKPAEPGTVTAVTSDRFDVACGEGTLQVEKIKPEGKKVMSVHDFLLGSKLVEGTRFS